MNHTERFEIVGLLYYRATGYLRPGKSEAPETGRDSNDPGNTARFEDWLATRGFGDAISLIAQLQAEVELLTHERDAARDIHREPRA
ncbi:MAG TPA: hypothetical protein VGK73_19135 [Polyangiaceae bacterium]